MLRSFGTKPVHRLNSEFQHAQSTRYYSLVLVEVHAPDGGGVPVEGVDALPLSLSHTLRVRSVLPETTVSPSIWELHTPPV